MIPLSVATPGGTCFAAYDWAPGRGVLIVPPFGVEAASSARIWRDFAVLLAKVGIAVLRPELPGTGDSGGSPLDPDQVASWRGAVRASHAWLAERHGGKVALLGCRFGALLALDAIGRGVPADGLVLLDPPASGAAFARSLKARALFEGWGEPPEGPDFIQSYGVPVSAATLADLVALPAPFSAGCPLPPVLVVTAAAPNPWPDRLRESGAAVTVEPFEGHAEFVLQGSMQAQAPSAVFDNVLTFLQTLPAASAAPPPSPSRGLVLPDMVEEPVRFGDGLFGILCRPERPSHGAPAVVLPSFGNRPRSGPNQSWTMLARRLAQLGITSLRYDSGAAGESAAHHKVGQPRLAPVVEAYLPQRIVDLRAAMDVISARGCRAVVLVGHCSGAYAAWQAAIVDERVAGLMAVNMTVVGLQSESSAASLLRPAPVLKGAEPHAAHAAGRLSSGNVAASGGIKWMGDAVRRGCPRVVWDFARRMGPEERNARQGLASLVARGCVVHFVYSSAPGEDYRFRRAFGSHPKFPPNVSLTVLAGADHEFSNRHHRVAYLDLVTGFVKSFTGRPILQRTDMLPVQEIST